MNEEEVTQVAEELAQEIGKRLFGDTANKSRLAEIKEISKIIREILLEDITNDQQVELDQSKLDIEKLTSIIETKCKATMAGYWLGGGGRQFPTNNANLVETKELLRASIKGKISDVIKNMGDDISDKLFFEGADDVRAEDKFIITYRVLAAAITPKDLKEFKQLDDEEKEIMVQILKDAIYKHCKFTTMGLMTGGIYFPSENIGMAREAVKSIMENKQKLISAEKEKRQALETIAKVSVSDEVIEKVKNIDGKLQDALLSKEEKNILTIAKDWGAVLEFLVKKDLSSSLGVVGSGIDLIYNNPEKIAKAMAMRSSPSLKNFIEFIGGKEQLAQLLGNEDFRAMLLLYEEPLLYILRSNKIYISADQLHAALAILSTKPEGKDFSVLGLLDILADPEKYKETYFKDMWQQIRAMISSEGHGLHAEIVNLLKKESEQANEKTIKDIDVILQTKDVADNIRWLGINDNNRTQMLSSAKDLLLEGGERSGNGLLKILDGVFRLSPAETFLQDILVGVQELILDEQNKPRDALVTFIQKGQLAIIMDNLMQENPALLNGYLGREPFAQYHNLSEDQKQAILKQNALLHPVVKYFCELLEKDSNLLQVIVAECPNIIGINNKMGRINAGLKIATALTLAIKGNGEMKEAIFNYLKESKSYGLLEISAFRYISESVNIMKFALWIVDGLCKIADAFYQMRISNTSANPEMTNLIQDGIHRTSKPQNFEVMCQNIANNKNTKVSGAMYYALTHKQCQGVDFKYFTFENTIVDGFSFKNACFGDDTNGTTLKGVFKNTDFSNCKFRGNTIDFSAAQFDEVSRQSLQQALSNIKQDNKPEIKLPIVDQQTSKSTKNYVEREVERSLHQKNEGRMV